VVLEAHQGTQSLRQLSHHTATYTSILVTAVTRVTSQSPVTAVLHPSSGGGDCSAAAGAGLAALAWALRCLESIVGREGSFQLHTTAVASVLQAVAEVLHAPAAASAAPPPAVRAAGGGMGGGGDEGAVAAVSAACSLLVSLLRHRGRELRRLMAPVVASCRGLLHLIAAWLQRPALGAHWVGGGEDARGGGVVRCAEQLGRMYQAVADQQLLLGRYCHLLLADYVVAAALAAHSDASLTSAAPQSNGGGAAAKAEVARALRGGAHALFGVVAPAELQHVHAVVGQGLMGPARRAALAELKRSHDREFKYKGKT